MVDAMLERAIRRAIRIALAFATIIVGGGAASALPPPGTCSVVTRPNSGDRPPPCTRSTGRPAGYENAVLWLRLPMTGPSFPRDIALFVHSTRFDRLHVLFVFVDGSREVQGVRKGAFGDHWHMGGQIAFRPRPHSAALTAIWLKIDRLQSYELLRFRLVPAERVAHQLELMAALIGAALALLTVASVCNFALAGAGRPRFFLWHGLWAATMVGWGLVWSQGALALFPRIAGTTSSVLATVLACLAVLLASLSTIGAFEGILSHGIRRAIIHAGLAVVALGGWSAMPGADLHVIGMMLTLLILSILVAIGSGLVLGWHRRDRDTRNVLFAWGAPMLVLAATQVFDFSTGLLGGGAQIAVLFASAFQTICLSALATHRLGALRVERDAAIASETALAELAERDALTGLLNRRGFVRRCDQAYGGLHPLPFGLLLIDVDRFKHINDRFGHEAGDAVLIRIGDRLRALEGPYPCLTGRLGGEEFVIGISGLAASSLRQFADQVRMGLGTGGDGTDAGCPGVTVSIGISAGTGSGPFALLYGQADRALYRAKADGRDRVVCHGELAMREG